MRRVDIKHMFQAWSCFIHPSFRHTYSQFLPLKSALSHLHSIGCHHPNLQSEKTEVQENNKTSQDPNKCLYLSELSISNNSTMKLMFLSGEHDIFNWLMFHCFVRESLHTSVPVFKSLLYFFTSNQGWLERKHLCQSGYGMILFQSTWSWMGMQRVNRISRESLEAYTEPIETKLLLTVSLLLYVYSLLLFLVGVFFNLRWIE